MHKKFYITAPIFYPNADLHLGHAYTTVLCDVLARTKRLTGYEVYFLTGNDDHAAKVAKAATALNLTPKEFVDQQAEKFKNFYQKLEISADDFIQTSDKEKHFPGAIKLWQTLKANGDIELKKYQGLYCVGCEAFKTEKELIDGLCPDHNTKPEVLEEENYFFKVSKYVDTVKAKIKSGELEISPASRKNEILSFLDQEAMDISFSRPVEKVNGWGIPVPGDPSQIMYVWCDALVNYISALGYGRTDNSLLEKFWPADVHVMGKDIVRFHAVIWPAMLLSSNLALPKKILGHGFITSNGQKMSKSIGNVVDPVAVINEYGAEALRYFLIRHMNIGDDSGFTMERFKEAYNAGLANGLGNLVSRVMKMAQDNLTEAPEIPDNTIPQEFFELIDKFEFNKATDLIWQKVSELDQKIQITEPFKLVKTDPNQGIKIIKEIVVELYTIGRMLNPIMPETNILIKKLVKDNKVPSAPLFPRKD